MSNVNTHFLCGQPLSHRIQSLGTEIGSTLARPMRHIPYSNYIVKQGVELASLLHADTTYVAPEILSEGRSKYLRLLETLRFGYLDAQNWLDPKFARMTLTPCKLLVDQGTEKFIQPPLKDDLDNLLKSARAVSAKDELAALYDIGIVEEGISKTQYLQDHCGNWLPENAGHFLDFNIQLAMTKVFIKGGKLLIAIEKYSHSFLEIPIFEVRVNGVELDMKEFGARILVNANEIDMSSFSDSDASHIPVTIKSPLPHAPALWLGKTFMAQKPQAL